MSSRILVPLTSSSATYAEWDVMLSGVQYCVVHDVDRWELLRFHDSQWITHGSMSVDAFLEAHHLILADE